MLRNPASFHSFINFLDYMAVYAFRGEGALPSPEKKRKFVKIDESRKMELTVKLLKTIDWFGWQQLLAPKI